MSANHYYVHLRSEGRQRRVALTAKFYSDVYQPAFPKFDQAEGPDVWLPLMNDKPSAGQPELHITLACESADRVVGGVIFENYRVSGCWLATYIAVRTDARRHGIAKGLMTEVRRTIDAATQRDWYLFAETEDPLRINDVEERTNAQNRLRALARFGLYRVCFSYVQPALGPDKQPVDDLMLLCLAPTGEPRPVPTDRVKSFLTEFYEACDQAASPHLVRMCEELGDRDTLDVVALLDRY